VVAFLAGRLLFGCDDGGEDGVYAVDECGIWEELFGYEDAGAGEEDVVPFVLEGGEMRGIEGVVGWEGIDWDVGDCACGERIVDWCRLRC